MLSWLWIGILCIIWAAFLLPSRRGPSPYSSVEAFERKMSMLAEANKAVPGRWVLVPRKGERLMGARERNRQRVRRRRKVIFTVLLELTALTLIIGLFPPLRPMLNATAVLGGVLFLYLLLLLRLRVGEVRRARARRVTMARRRIAIEGPDPVTNGYSLAEFATNGYGSNGHAGSGYSSNGHASNGHGSIGNGHLAPRKAVEELLTEAYLTESGVRIVEDDVHVIIRRASEIETEDFEEAAAR